MEKGATISDDGVYRYVLWRIWDRTKSSALFIMLNPSTANAEVDDPTIRRCVGFARAWGMGGLRVVNLYPFRTPSPKVLFHADNASMIDGFGNFDFIEDAVDRDGMAIAAWGEKAKVSKVNEVKALFRRIGVPLHALELTGRGMPSHPLYIRKTAVPFVYSEVAPPSPPSTEDGT